MKQELKCYRKHLIKDQNYDIMIDDSKMTLSNYPNPPKYTILLQWSVEISWHLYGGEFAFGFTTNNKFKWFHSKPSTILQLKSILSKCVTFTHLKQYYQPGFLIANGTASTIYQMTRKSDNNSDFAVKCILKEQADMNKLYQQLNILKLLDHPNLTKFEEFYVGDGTYYIVFEFIRGQPLNQIIKEAKPALSLPQIQKIMQDLLSALLYLRHLNIIHRDIKPENIQFDRKTHKTIKLVHFEFACKIGQDLKKYGTPGYAAPEILNSDKYGIECDMFSLGCVFYKLLVKKDLFQGQNKGEVLAENKKCKLNLQNLELIRIPYCAQHLLAEMLKADPKLRITVLEAMNHPFFQATMQYSSRNLSVSSSRMDRFNLMKQQKQDLKQEEDEIKLDDYFTNELPPAMQIPIMNEVKGGQRESSDDIGSHFRKRVSKSTG